MTITFLKKRTPGTKNTFRCLPLITQDGMNYKTQ